MRGVANAKTVVGESVIVVLISSDINITVIEIVEGRIPIALACVSKRMKRKMETYVLSKPMPCVNI